MCRDLIAMWVIWKSKRTSTDAELNAQKAQMTEITAAMFARSSRAGSDATDDRIFTNTGLEAKVADLQMKLDSVFGGASKVVVGGLGSQWPEEDAAKWLRDTLAADSGHSPTNICAKGQFTGMLFVEFSSTSERDRAIKKLNDSKHQWDGQIV